jgi:hypothetical protein
MVVRDLHIITRKELWPEDLKEGSENTAIFELQRENVDYRELLQLIFECDHVHVW